MTQHSQNGWPVITGSQVGLKIITAGPAGMSVRADAGVPVVLEYLARRFHHEVEPLVDAQCGGYNPRHIEGSSFWSNHASGTAIDLNWSKHPQGRRGTFTRSQDNALARILQDCDDVIRWGGDYAGTIDEMHFEIVAGTAAVHALAAKITTVEDDEMTQAQFDELMSAWWLKHMAPKVADNAERSALRVAPWQQAAGGTKMSTHDATFSSAGILGQVADIGAAVVAMQDTIGEIHAAVVTPA
jgi:hypothetical protein